jgi:predicted metal-dependent peptidase
MSADNTALDELQLTRLKSATNTVMKDHPFFAPAMAGMPLVLDRTIPTACTDGRVIRFNPDFTATLNDYELVGLLIHEVCHPLFGHLVRFASAVAMGNGRLANIATDYEINNLLTEYSNTASRPIVLPKDGCVDLERFKTKAAEAIYKSLQEEELPPPPPPPPKPPEGDEEGEGDGEGDGDGKGGEEGEGTKPDDSKDGESKDGSGTKPDKPEGGSGGQPLPEPVSPGEFEIPKGTPEEIAEQEDKWREILSTSIHASKLRGDAPGGFLEKLQQLQKSPLNMKDILQKYADEFCMDEGSTKPDKRFLANHDLCVAGMEDERIGSLVFVNDTSGSMPARVAEVCCSVIQNAVNTLNADRLIHMDVDSRVAKVREYAPYQPVDIEIHGRGGTDFRPAFDWVEDNRVDPRVLVYMTDGWGTFPESPPNMPVLWLTWGKGAAEYPFGDVIDLEQIDQATT